MGLLGSLFEKASPATAQQLLAYAVDKTADLGGRDDAVLELSAYDLAEVESALLRMAGDEAEEEICLLPHLRIKYPMKMNPEKPERKKHFA